GTDVVSFETGSFKAQLLELQSGVFDNAGAIPQIRIEFSEDLEAGLTMDDVKGNLTAYQADGTTEIAGLINTVTQGATEGDQNSLMVTLDETVFDTNNLDNQVVVLKYSDLPADGGVENALSGEFGSALGEFTFSLFADEFHTEVVVPGLSTVSGATTSTNELWVNFDGGSLDSGDMNQIKADLLNSLSIVSSGTTITGAIEEVAEISGYQIKLRLNHDAIGTATNELGDALGIESGDALSVVYSNATNSIRSIDGQFADSFTQNFVYQPSIDFSTSGYQGTEFWLNFSGGNLDITDQTDGKYQAILNQIQVSTDADFENIITDAVDSIVDLNAEVLKLNLDQTELQSSGVENGDKLYIRYNAGTTALKSEVGNTDIAGFETEFYVDLSELPHFGDATYNANGDDFELTFTQGTFNTAGIDAKKTAIINQIEIATDADFSNEITAVITDITVTD
ncbi:MAG: hypothetical protein VXY99_11100, partial [Pseudomonadota bacterium]|nr:hypothetical protein [Pseudomonadota bacterium]